MKKETKKSVTLQFERNELLNDIEGYAYVEGDVMRADAAHLEHGKHQTQDITQEGNIDLVTRHLDLAMAYLKEKLHMWVKTDVADGTRLDDKLKEKPKYVMSLSVPEDTSQSTVEFLEQLIHNLLVYWTLWHWLKITKPESAAGWLQEYSDLLDEVKGVLGRSGKCRKFQSPF